MTRYLRLGKVPQDEKSINYFSNKKEEGVSVFELSSNDTIIFKNLQLISSFAARLEAPIYIVTGDIVGIGNDGEPLLKDVIILEEIFLNKNERIELVLTEMTNTFNLKYGSLDLERTTFAKRVQELYVNPVSGEEKDYWYVFGNNLYDEVEGWEKEIRYTYLFGGFTFTNPVNFKFQYG